MILLSTPLVTKFVMSTRFMPLTALIVVNLLLSGCQAELAQPPQPPDFPRYPVNIPVNNSGHQTLSTATVTTLAATNPIVQSRPPTLTIKLTIAESDLA